jgi:hypothetical protein
MLGQCAGLAVAFLAAGAPAAQEMSDRAQIEAVIDLYSNSQADLDLRAQAEIMAPDRIWVSRHFSGRRNDNARNMHIQQAEADAMRADAPGLQQFVEDLDREVRFLADGRVAVVTLVRHTTRLFPAGTPENIRLRYDPGPPVLMTLVLERRAASWVIVATHVG